MSDDICSQLGVTCRDEADQLRASLLDVAGLSELFKALSDETRTKILHLVSQRELCVCDLAFLLEMTLPAVSHTCASSKHCAWSRAGRTASWSSTAWTTAMS